MDQKQFCRMQKGNGFIAALDQSGGSTPKALRLYGIPDGSYHGDEEMFDLIHETVSYTHLDVYKRQGEHCSSQYFARSSLSLN